MEMGKEVLILNLDDVLPNRFQPRIKFNEQSILELAESIKEHGVIQPIVVRKIADKYEIIAGERRYKASILAGKKTIPAIVTNLDDKNSAEIALIENVQRQDLTPIEEAISYKKILDMGYINQAALAEKLGKTQSTIANKLRLLNLADEVQEALLEEKISERHARSLLKLNKEDQVKMLNRVISERMTVRKTDEEINKLLNGSTDDVTSGEELEISQKKDNEVSLSEEKKDIINPGFMDIDKIESQAQDIFKPIEKDPVEEEIILDVNPSEIETVSPISQPIINKEINEEPQSVESKPIVGRFFNMVNMNSENRANSNYIDDLEEQEVNMDFNKPVETPATEFQFNTIASTGQSSDSEKTNESQVEIGVESQPSQFITQPNFGNPTSLHMPVNSPPIEAEIDTFQSINPLSLTDDTEFEGPVNSQVEIANPREDIMSSNINNVEIQPVMIDNVEESTPIVDMKTIINTVRDCVSKIESYGYTVDEEEMDLENTYQVTITINKQ